MLNKKRVLLLLITIFTMIIPVFSFPVYALSIDWPEKGEVFPSNFMDPQTNIQTTIFNFYDPFYSPWASFPGDPFDGAQIVLQFNPVGLSHFGPGYDEGNYCEETFGGFFNINTIDYSKMNVICNFGFLEKFAEYYIPSPPYNNWFIFYTATDQFSFDTHHQEFLNALSTIDLQS